MLRKFVFSIDEFYHLYNRGVDKRVIFLDTHDYERFLKLLYLCNSNESVVMKEVEDLSFAEILNLKREQAIVDVGCFCLMPNHFHLLVREKKENGISVFIKKILTAYSMYFNKKYDRTGNLFEGPFRATHVDNDSYLKYLFAYIHLNPIKIINKNWLEKGIKKMVKEKDFVYNYRYSSCREYLKEKSRSESRIINKEVFPKYFSDKQEFDTFINDCRTLQGQSLEN